MAQRFLVSKETLKIPEPANVPKKFGTLKLIGIP